MIERLKQLLQREKLSYSGFADLIGVQRSSVSHIMSGRNKPSFDFMQKTMRALPHLNADWLILGEGSMYEEGFEDMSPDDVFMERTGLTRLETAIPDPSSGKDHVGLSEGEKAASRSEHTPDRSVKRVIVLFTDNSFESYEPGG
jgi:transcriptional regulator with XRE-family HTH domain